MRVLFSLAALTGLVALVAADQTGCPSSLLSVRGGGFFDKLDAKISSVTKSGNDVRTHIWLCGCVVGVWVAWVCRERPAAATATHTDDILLCSASPALVLTLSIPTV